MFKSKGAVLVLVWSFCGFSVLHFLFDTHFSHNNIQWHIGKVTITRLQIVPPCFMVYSLFGWIADMKFGRYKVIKWSFIMLMVFSVIFCIISVFQKNFSSNVINKILLVWHVPMTLALGGILANAVQLGTDQLHDASSEEIVSFIGWWAWVWMLSGVTSSFGQSCFCKYPALTNLFLPSAAALAVCLDFVFHSWLKEESPPTRNVLSLIYQVLSYAMKHKYPTRISSYDWDKRLSARLDVGQTKYGGPFTTEEVEDVKTFFRITIIILAGVGFFGLYFPLLNFFPNYIDKLSLSRNATSVDCNQSIECFRKTTVAFSGDIAIVILYPLLEFTIFPIFRRYFVMSMLRRSFIGMFLALVSVIATVLIVFVAEQKSSIIRQGACSWDADHKLTISYYWMAIPNFLVSAVQMFVLTSSTEFISAQSPYSLKGFIFGMLYGFIGVSATVGYCISLVLKLITEKWPYKPYGCTFWYLVLTLLVFLVLFVVAGISFRCYKRRQREDQHMSNYS